MTKNVKNLQLKKIGYFFDKKLQFSYRVSLGLHKNNLQQVDMITFILSFSGQQMAQQMVQTNPELVEQLRRQMGGGFPPGAPPPPPSDL
jgi:hypothetical protein